MSMKRIILRKRWSKTSVITSVVIVIFFLELYKYARQFNRKIILFKEIDEDTENKINSSNTAAVLFRSEQITREEMPPINSRRKDQLYIWTAGESAPSLFHLRKIWLFWENKYVFNMTMTYRRDSSLYHPYGTVTEAYSSIQRLGFVDNPGKILAMKTKLAVAVVSNCNSTSGAKVRMQLLKNLKHAGLQADYYGSCFGNQTVPKGNREDFENLLSKYKFYFAFENSYHCKDYVTEKFYRNALYLGVVPVVWGTLKEDYESVAPPRSFIHVEDYPSINHLIKYLNYLNTNDTAYLEYFRWHTLKEYDQKQFNRDYTYCVLCKILHGKNLTDDSTILSSKVTKTLFTKNAYSSPFPSLRSWFYNGNIRDCLRTQLRILGNNTKIY
uniref:3-galactosyl-N-acetylglucosaminide 4-alpha-L-fucosyltransferase FUT3-like isoform X1 n=2 Tax=Styela clava TaxID=7725 RepID=UPI00193A9FC9|nr:3-galactosyl-N-acetylglucosaminide 4-alpha-L-fucosyltransferase FUT3-like isoform X1 [Styela clava]